MEDDYDDLIIVISGIYERILACKTEGMYGRFGLMCS